MNVANVVLAIALLSSIGAHARELEVSQKQKMFVQDDGPIRELHVNVGDSVSFRNDDPFFHNIYSASQPAEFDLGSYPQGQARKVLFDKAGTVVVECAIHPNMKLRVEVGK